MNSRRRNPTARVDVGFFLHHGPGGCWGSGCASRMARIGHRHGNSGRSAMSRPTAFAMYLAASAICRTRRRMQSCMPTRCNSGDGRPREYPRVKNRTELKTVIVDTPSGRLRGNLSDGFEGFQRHSLRAAAVGRIGDFADRGTSSRGKAFAMHSNSGLCLISFAYRRDC